jgi:uncharacterized membrane protein YoaK (UPF0700 family)
VGQGNQRRGRSRVVRHEREIPEKSEAWLIAGRTLLSIDVGVIVAAATASKQIGIRPETLWVIAAALLVVAVVCFFAHRDANRGRTFKQLEVFVEESEDDDPRPDPF